MTLMIENEQAYLKDLHLLYSADEEGSLWAARRPPSPWRRTARRGRGGVSSIFPTSFCVFH